MNIVNYFKIKDWYFHPGIMLIGFFSYSLFYTRNLALYLIMTMSLVAYAYSINQFYDERLKRKYFILPLTVYLLSLPFIAGEYATILFSLLFFALATVYSFGKIYLKATPSATIIDPVGHSMLFLIGYGSVDTYAIAIFFLFLPLLALSRILHELNHFKDDKRNKIKNISILVGKGNAVKLFKILGIAAILYAAFLYANRYLSPILTTLLILFTALFIITIKENITKKYRRLFRYLAILVGIVWLVQR